MKLKVDAIRSGDILLCKAPHFDDWYQTKKKKIAFIPKQIVRAQLKMGFGIIDAQWTHAMSAGLATTTVSAVWPNIKLMDIQRDYINKGYYIRAYRYTKWRTKNDVSDRMRFLAWCWSDNNRRYDLLGLIGFKFREWFHNRITLHRKNSVFCSEQVMRGLRLAGEDYYKSIAGHYPDLWTTKFMAMPDKFSPAHLSYALRDDPDWVDVTQSYYGFDE